MCVFVHLLSLLLGEENTYLCLDTPFSNHDGIDALMMCTPLNFLIQILL